MAKSDKALPLVLLVWMLLALTASPAFSRTLETGARTSAAGPPLDFDAAARLALRQSPLFTRSALEIELKRLDETDSRSAFLPSVTLRTRYFVHRPEDPHLNPRSYSVSFLTEDYNPIKAYFSLQIRKLLTRMAILSHLRVIGSSAAGDGGAG